MDTQSADEGRTAYPELAEGTNDEGRTTTDDRPPEPALRNEGTGDRPPSTISTKERDTGYWAEGVSTLKVSSAPAGAVNINVEGRRVVGPLQGFGPLWQKTYRLRLEGLQASPAEVISVWKREFPSFQPPENRFYPSVEGVKPGEVVLINAQTPGGLISTGVMVMYADDESFTLMTPQGHPESGWVTFSAYEQDGCTIAQVQSMARANDPMYEVVFRIVGSKEQERIWRHVLTSLAAYYGLEGHVEFSKSCVDPKLQWRQAGNIWHNAAIRTTVHKISAPVRWLKGAGVTEVPGKPRGRR